MTAATVTLAARGVIARYGGRCRACDRPVTPGQPIDLWAEAYPATGKAVTHTGCSPTAQRAEHRCAACLGPTVQDTVWDRHYRRKVSDGPPTCPRCHAPAPAAEALTIEGVDL